MGWLRSRRRDDHGAAPPAQEPLAGIRPGVPGRCPACGGLGYIDISDLAQRFQVQRCTGCQHRWEYLFDADGVVVGLTELDASGRPVRRSRVRPTRPGPPIADAPDDVVLDLRDPAPAEPAAPEAAAPDRLSPAEWIRQSIQR